MHSKSSDLQGKIKSCTTELLSTGPSQIFYVYANMQGSVSILTDQLFLNINGSVLVLFQTLLLSL